MTLFAATWSRESHGLFDYEAKHPIKKQFKIVQPATIIRRQTDVMLATSNQPPDGIEPLARVSVKGSRFFVDIAKVSYLL